MGGFSEVSSNRNARNNSFEFTFAEGTTVSDFSLLMLDYGDYNAFGAQGHNVFLTAYSGDQQIGQDSLAGQGKASGGDANSPDGVTEFGRTNLAVQGENITSVKLTFDFQKGGDTHNKSFDPFLGFDSLSFTANEADSADVPEPATALALLVVGAVGTTTLKRKKA
ncbi:MAG: PEP-CTERM sorting domain-containing protein [Leptolyngbyaceae cyanobacterium]